MAVNQILSTKGKEVYSILSTNTVYEALAVMSEKNIVYFWMSIYLIIQILFC